MTEHRLIIGLIMSHYEKDEEDFKNRCRKIVNYFDDLGKSELAEYVMGLCGDAPTFCPQEGEVQ